MPWGDLSEGCGRVRTGAEKSGNERAGGREGGQEDIDGRDPSIIAHPEMGQPGGRSRRLVGRGARDRARTYAVK
ncbi:hypothetical protein GCM10010335_52350 [Streptomyces galbus]|nr:hypothetical protein GCM10010335_52350 [Streptomyces galbus]